MPLDLRKLLAGGVIFAVAAAPGARAQGGHGWMITDSSGSFDIPFVPGLAVFQLWLECDRWGSGEGVATAEFDLVSTNPVNTVLEFSPRNGFLNAGGATDLRLAVDGCPRGRVLAGEIFMLLVAPGSLCLGPSAKGIKATTSCQDNIWEIAWQGILFGGEYCGEGATNLCGILDWHLPCCYPDGTCKYVNPMEYCTGVVPPIPCEYYDCQPISTEPESWGRAKSRYR